MLSWSIKDPHFMKSVSSLICSQKPTTSQMNLAPHTHYFFKMHFNTIIPPTHKSPNCPPLQIFQLQTFYAFLTSPCVPHVTLTLHIQYLFKKLIVKLQ